MDRDQCDRSLKIGDDGRDLRTAVNSHVGYVLPAVSSHRLRAFLAKKRHFAFRQARTVSRGGSLAARTRFSRLAQIWPTMDSNVRHNTVRSADEQLVNGTVVRQALHYPRSFLRARASRVTSPITTARERVTLIYTCHIQREWISHDRHYFLGRNVASSVHVAFPFFRCRRALTRSFLSDSLCRSTMSLSMT